MLPESCATLGLSAVRSTVEADMANPHLLGEMAATTSSAPRSVMVTRPPQKTNCAITVTTSAGMVCSPVLTMADSNSPSNADTNAVPKAASHSSMVPSIAWTAPSGPGLRSRTTVINKAPWASVVANRTQTFADR